MSTNVGSIHYDLDLDTKKFKDEADKVGGHIRSIGKTVAIGAAVAGAAVVAFGVSAVRSFQDSELAGAQLNAVLKSTGGIAGVTADQANSLASSLQKVTRYSDEAVLGAENMLLTFTNIGKDIFPQTTEAVLDMATAMGTDLKSTAIQVGKALQDPIQGVTALQRVGVRLTDSQKDLVEKLVKSGRAAEAQKLILKELQVEFGGSAKAAGKTFAGQLDILKNSFDDVKESIGLTIVNALTPLASQMSTFVASDKFQAWLKELNVWLSINVPKAINWITTVGWPFLINVFNATWPVIKLIAAAFGELIVFINNNQWVLWGLVAAFVAIKTAMFLNGALQAFQGVMAGVRISFMATRAVVMTPIIMPAIVIAAVIAAFVVVMNKWKETADVINRTKNAIADLDASNTQVNARMNKMLIGTGAQAARTQEQLLKMGRSQASINKTLGIPAYAGGTDYHPGGLAMVGERGPELVSLPRGSQVIPNDRLAGVGGQTITNKTIISGNIYLQDKSAVDAFFMKLNRNGELASKGMATI